MELSKWTTFLQVAQALSFHEKKILGPTKSATQRMHVKSAISRTTLDIYFD